MFNKLWQLLVVLALIASCTSTYQGLSKEKIVFQKKHIGNKRSYTLYCPDIAGKTKTVIQVIGGHGYGFEVRYSDSSMIYFSNDQYLPTPNADNYQTIEWKLNWLEYETMDTTVYGRQTDQRYWKEIIQNKSYLGYVNVHEDDKALFEKALLSFKK
ncbi:MAG: hypothetical protein EP332_09710 [Bacteroidetes bacterium]|nr:MAG: hypothetical protein EP332_09710 [Bacteroidota bacterium]